MVFVSKELIERAWKRMAALGALEAKRLQNRHRKAQNALTMHAYSFSDEYREEACGVLLYVYHVIVDAFMHVTPRPRRVGRGQIESVLADHDLRPNSALEVLESSSEPYAITYAYEAFTEDDSDVVLGEHELESFIGIIAVVVQCLHRACQRK